MGTTATLVYDVDPAGASAAAVAARMAAAPIPVDLLALYGLRVTSDGVGGVAPVKRTIVLNFLPSVTGVGHTTLFVGDPSGSRVNQAIVDAPGLDYIAPPGVVLSPPAAFPVTAFPPHVQQGVQATATVDLNVQRVTVDAGGAAYNGATFAIVVGAMAPPRQDPKGGRGQFLVPSCVQRLNISGDRTPSGPTSALGYGRGYSTSTKVQFQGGLGVGGVAAQGDCIVSPNGRIKSVRLTNPGSGYIKAPKVFFYDPVGHGSGALVSATMGEGTPATLAVTVIAGVVTAIAVATNGSGYIGVPAIVIIDPTGAGSGALAHARMGLNAMQVINRGSGYTAPPTVTFVPRFKTLFPDQPTLAATVKNQQRPFWRLMESAIALTAVTPVVSEVPVIA